MIGWYGLRYCSNEVLFSCGNEISTMNLRVHGHDSSRLPSLFIICMHLSPYQLLSHLYIHDDHNTLTTY